MTARRSAFLILWLGLSYAFLYLPIVLLVLFSFNESRLVTVWSGFSTRWYAELASNTRVIDAALLSLTVATVSASIAVVLGTLAALALARFGRFVLRLPLAGMLVAPLVMPEVITGLSLLLLFVSSSVVIGWPVERGLPTVIMAHATFGIAYVAVVVQARLKLMDPQIEEAASDLGAPPARTFIWITLPTLLPALAAGWLLAFTLSLDDLVIASFTTGPGATTLPMVVYSSVRLGLSPQINALASLFIAVAAILVTAAAWLSTPKGTLEPQSY
jgi:putrescine transport system permease protein